MQRPPFRFQLKLLAALMSVTLAACSSSTADNTGNGGDEGSGGKPGSGGQPAAGGVNGTGGRSGSGGATGSGDKTGSGGRVGLGGTTGPGGQSGTGGKAAGGGAVGGQLGSGGTSTAGGQPGRDAGRDVGTGSGGHGDGGPSGTGDGGTGGSTGSGTDGGGGVPSAGCGKTASTLKNSPSSSNFNQNTISVSGTSRQFIIRWPDDYKNTTPYRLIVGLHGAGGKGADVAGATSKEGPYFGLWDLSKGTTIFVAPSAGGSQHYWDATSDTAFVKAILELVEGELCIDTSRIMLEGFSQGAALSWTLACGLEGVFRAAVGHSGGGVTPPSKCQPIAYFGSGGTKENVTQTTQSDQFAKWDGCTVQTFAAAPSGSHSCNDYKDCSAGHPVRWCPFDDSHMPDPADSGKSTSWMPSEVWPFLAQF